MQWQCGYAVRDWSLVHAVVGRNCLCFFTASRGPLDGHEIMHVLVRDPN
jgi:hypothetical protein